MRRTEHAHPRPETHAAMRDAAAAACRAAAGACARTMLASTAGGEGADERMRLAMDGIEVFAMTAGVVGRSSPCAASALALAEALAEGCATAFAGDEAAATCRECARRCRELRTSAAPARLRCVAA